MLRSLIYNWWLLMVRSVFALLFAAAVIFFQPLLVTWLLTAVAHTAITVLFSVFALVTGLVTLGVFIRGGHYRDTWLLLLDGAIVTAGGLLVLLLPALTLSSVVLFIAATAILAGILEIATGLRLRRHLADESLLLAGGIVSLAFGFFLFVTRARDSQSALLWVAMYALASGLAMAGLSFRLFRLRKSIHALAGVDDATRAKSAHHR